MRRRERPQQAAAAFRAALEVSAPATPLAIVQSAWRSAVGDAIAAQAQPVAERDGVVTVSCRSSTWAQELDLMQEQLLVKVNAVLAAANGVEIVVERLRFNADWRETFE
jgi:predicted nucleic acid-binding Zn ribbon protein